MPRSTDFGFTVMILLAALLCTGIPAPAQTMPDSASWKNESFSIGVYAGYGLNDLHAAFSVDTLGMPTSSSECGRFESGSGNGIVIGAIVEFPLSQKLRLSLLPEYADRSGTMRFPCVDPAMTRLPNGTVVPALTDHIVSITSRSLATRITADFQPLPIPLQFSAGPFVSLPLSIGYRAWEEIVEPRSAEFVSGGQVREYGSGNFDTGIQFGVAGAARYRARIGDRLTLLPEISYLLPLNDEAAATGLRTGALRGILGLVYRFDRSNDTVVAPPVAQPAVPTLAASLAVHSMTANGLRGDTLNVRTGRTILTELHPLLNYLFFEKGSAEIPSRYIRRTRSERAAFNEHTQHAPPLTIYHNLLDIIGARMERFPSATITLTGTQPDAPGTSSLALATERASNIRDYLTNIWQIDSSRIAISARQNPATPSNPGTEEGVQENRRVEISSDTYEITEPVLLSDTTIYAAALPLLLDTKVDAAAGVERWEVGIDAGTRELASFSGSGAPPEAIDWLADSALSALQILPGQLRARLTVRDRAGNERRAEATLPVRRTQEDSVSFGAGFYSLILFDFGRALLNTNHLRTVELVNSRTSPRATAKVFGYTDKIGEASVNLQLSASRAEAVAKFLKVKVVEVSGRGVNTTLYDNSLPEGRFYSRSVTIQTE
jgi:outer membrane protein OmpA-like peptidoglycan-associated protein